MNKLTIVSLLTMASAVFASQAIAMVPDTEVKGVPAITTCPTSVTGQPIPDIYHSDKIVFVITGQLQAALSTDQVKLDALARNTEMDIKVQDDPTQVADIKKKVLTFLGAAITSANAQALRIISVEYAIAVCPKSPLAF